MKLKYIINWLMFSLIMSFFLIPFCIDYKQVIGGGFILGFITGVLSKIEGNARK